MKHIGSVRDLNMRLSQKEKINYIQCSLRYLLRKYPLDHHIIEDCIDKIDSIIEDENDFKKKRFHEILSRKTAKIILEAN